MRPIGTNVRFTHRAQPGVQLIHMRWQGTLLQRNYVVLAVLAFVMWPATNLAGVARCGRTFWSAAILAESAPILLRFIVPHRRWES